jgi:energy-coupling factor transport system ATP-binding protein
MPSSRAPIIELEGVSFRYAEADDDALRGVSLAIAEGEHVAILGRNGAGKTTLAHCLAGIIPGLVAGDLRGAVRIAGVASTSMPVRDRATTVGIVFDTPEFQMSQMTVAEEVAFGLENLGVPYEEMGGKIAGALAMVGLTGFEERLPLALSAGEQQRLAIAAVIAMRPRVLVMDEPTSNLDPIGKRDVLELATRLNREHGMTVVMVEHEVEVVARHADRVIVLDAGRIIAGGTPREVFAQRELLEGNGLRPPQAMDLAVRLRDGRAGWHHTLPVDADEAVAALEPRLAAATR